MHYSTKYQSPIGVLTLLSDGESLLGLWMDGQKYYGATMPAMSERVAEDSSLPILKKATEWLDAYFAGQNPAISQLPLAPTGTEFRQDVWGILCEIPYGEVLTYGEIATKMAVKRGKARMSSQAVGGAVGHNPISVIIPCHRVVGSDGSLTGFSGGIEKKIKLLELEGVDMTEMFVPAQGTAL
jgi:methylated-DNA-[protein]-cysteine S-methyltransferase